MSTIVGVLLAAGLGTRYDPSGESLKLLQPVPTGRHAGLPMVVAAARNLMTAVERTLAVVRPLHHPHQLQLHDLLKRESCELVICERATDGMGASLGCGVRASADAGAWVIALGDMPAIAPATVNAVVRALRAGHPTVAPVFAGLRGHPVGFAACCFDSLVASNRDRGARGVLENFSPHLIDTQDDGILVDIDH